MSSTSSSPPPSPLASQVAQYTFPRSEALDVEDLVGETYGVAFPQTGRLISLLPLEIISEIFIYVCAGGHSPFPRQTFTLTPLRLSHVCRLWRRVALRTPHLWTRLYMTLRGSDTTSAAKLTSLWISRSRRRPVRVDVDFSTEPGGAMLYPSDTLSYFRHITRQANHSMRAREKVPARIAKTYFETHVRASSFGVVPILEQRYLWYFGVEKSPDEEWEIQGQKSDKNQAFRPLLTVRGSRRSVAEFGFGLHEPLSTTLTVLELQDTNGVSCLSSLELAVIIDEFPHLRRVSAHIDQGDMPVPATRMAVRAKNLRILRLSWIYTADIGPFLDAVTAPVLTEFALLGDLPTGIGQWPHLLSFLRRSKPPIRRFDIEHLDGIAAHLEECLQGCHDLERLWLEGCILNDDFILSLGHGSRNILSTLKTLGLVGIGNINGDRLLRTLMRSNSALKEIYVVECDGVLQEHCDAISAHFGANRVNGGGTVLVMPLT